MLVNLVKLGHSFFCFFFKKKLKKRGGSACFSSSFLNKSDQLVRFGQLQLIYISESQLRSRLEFLSQIRTSCSLKKEYLVSPPYTHHIPANIRTQGTNRPWCMPAPPRLAKAIGFQLALTTSFVAPFTCDRYLHISCTVNCFFRTKRNYNC